MRKTKTTRYDVAQHLRTPEEMAAYLEACLEEAKGDAAFIAKALGDIARARGMTQVARDAGLSRESLYKALSGERSPDFDTILKSGERAGLKAARGRGSAVIKNFARGLLHSPAWQWNGGEGKKTDENLKSISSIMTLRITEPE
jgi:probable addiction module antidote protein